MSWKPQGRVGHEAPPAHPMVGGADRQHNPHTRDSVAPFEMSAETGSSLRAAEEAGALGYEFE